MKLKFCAACGSREDLQHHHLVSKSEGGSNAWTNRFTLCTACHHKMHQRFMHGVYSHSHLTREGLARARARGVQLGRRPEIASDTAKVAAIRAARAAGKSFREVAWEFEVGVGTVQRLTSQ